MIYVVAYQSDVRIGFISTEASLPLLKGSLKNFKNVMSYIRVSKRVIVNLVSVFKPLDHLSKKN
jgi:hypothetical protein